MAEICQRVLDGFRMPVELALNIGVPIFNGKGDIRNCSCYGAMRRLEHGTMVFERVLEKSLCRIVSFDEIQYGLVPEGGTIDAEFILNRMKEDYHAKL